MSEKITTQDLIMAAGFFEDADNKILRWHSKCGQFIGVWNPEAPGVVEVKLVERDAGGGADKITDNFAFIPVDEFIFNYCLG